MRGIDIAQVDLNLLVALDVLLHERNVTRAAKRLGRTQSAMSHALARLREMLGDPILVRVGGDMRPTPRAERLQPEITRLLETIGRVLEEEVAFDPASTERVFTICAPDFVSVVLPTLVARMAVDTPRASVELLPVGREVFRDVADGRYDLVVAPPRGDEVDGVDGVRVAVLDWAVYARNGHPATANWSARAWADYPHVKVRTSSGSESPVDRAARADQLERKVGSYLPHFLLAPPLLARTDMLLTVPRATLADMAPLFDLVALPCPLKLRPMALAVYWSAQRAHDPAVVWFRDTVRAVLAEVLATPREKPSASNYGAWVMRKLRK